MKGNRFWIEIITLCAGVAFGLVLALAIVGGAVVASGQIPEPPQSATPPAARQQTFTGMVTCSRCLAKHSAEIGCRIQELFSRFGPGEPRRAILPFPQSQLCQ